jgi:hypothetical protein
VTDLNLEISQRYCSYQGSMGSSADAEPPEKRHSREPMLRLSTKIVLRFELPTRGSLQGKDDQRLRDVLIC